MEREGRLVRAFVQLADTLVSGFDIDDFLQSLCEQACEVLDMSAAGVLLTDEQGALRLASASSHSMRVLEVFELQQAEGPCPDAFRDGQQVMEADLEAVEGKWESFLPQALSHGFHAVMAFPLRLRAHRIGALNLFRDIPGIFEETDITVAQALADVATIGILQQRALTGAKEVSAQLQHALTSRVVIEQAKGVLAERLGIDMEEAFRRLRAYARRRGLRLSHVSAEVVEGRLAADGL